MNKHATFAVTEWEWVKLQLKGEDHGFQQPYS